MLLLTDSRSLQHNRSYCAEQQPCAAKKWPGGCHVAQVALASGSTRKAPVTSGTKLRRQTTDSSTSPASRSSAAVPTAAPLQGHASRPTEPTSSLQPEAAALTVFPHPSPPGMRWSPRLSQSVIANTASPAGSIPPRASRGLTAASAEGQHMSMAHSRQGSKLGMPQDDREHLLMPQTLSSPRIVPKSLNSPEAQYAKMFPRPTQATSASLSCGLLCSPDSVPKGKAFTPSLDSLIRAKQSGLYANLQDAGDMAKARSVSRSPSQARQERLVSASIASPSYERAALKGRGAGGEVVPPRDQAERELWSQLQAAEQKFSKGEITLRK